MKAQGYYYSTIQDIVEWENKLKLKNNLSFSWTDEYKRTHQQKGKVKKLTTSVQCSANNFSDKVWYIGDSEDYRCRNKTKNTNGLCYLHQLRNQNISIKYWKDKK